MKRYLVTMVLALCSLGFAAEKEANWQNLSQLNPGQRIEVVQSDLAKHEGEFVRFDDVGITLLVENKERTVGRERVMRVSSVAHRVRNAVLLGIGGGVLGGVIVAGRTGEHSNAPVAGFLGGMAAGAIAGHALGAPRTYYRVLTKSALPDSKT